MKPVDAALASARVLLAEVYEATRSWEGPEADREALRRAALEAALGLSLEAHRDGHRLDRAALQQVLAATMEAARCAVGCRDRRLIPPARAEAIVAAMSDSERALSAALRERCDQGSPG